MFVPVMENSSQLFSSCHLELVFSKFVCLTRGKGFQILLKEIELKKLIYPCPLSEKHIKNSRDIPQSK